MRSSHSVNVHGYGAGACEDERDDEPDRARLVQGPAVDEEAGRGAERNDVGQGVQLEAERALRTGEARDAAVEHVEEHREDDQQRRAVVLRLVSAGL